MGTYTKVPITNKSQDPGPPYADADWFNRVDDGVDRAHGELDGHEGRIGTLEDSPSDDTIAGHQVVFTNPTEGQVCKFDSSGQIINAADLVGSGGSGTGGAVNVERGDSVIVEGAGTIDFSSAFTVSESPTGEANIGIPNATQSAAGLESAADKTKLDGLDSGAFAPSSHVGSGGSAHPAATTSVAGFMSGADKTKLDGLGSSYTPPWVRTGSTVLYAAYGDGALDKAYREGLSMRAVAGPTPGQVNGTAGTIARCEKFRLPKNLSPATAKIWTVTSTSSTFYKLGIYDGVTGAKVWDSGFFDTLANAVVSFAMSGVALEQDRDYWRVLVADSSGPTNAFLSPEAPRHSGIFGINAGLLGGRSLGIPECAQFSITGGILPATMPGRSAASYAGGSSGTLPIIFLEGPAS